MTFTYSGPSISAAFTAGVFNEALRLGADKAADATGEFDKARDAANDTPVPSLLSALSAANFDPALLDESVLNDALAQLDQTFGARSSLLEGVVEEIDAFFNEYFPGVNEGVEQARVALTDMLASSGIVDGRALARLLFLQARNISRRDVREAEDDAIAAHANAGFHVPSGQLAWTLAQMNRKEMNALADAEVTGTGQGASKESSGLERVLNMFTQSRTNAIRSFSTYLARVAASRYDESLQSVEAQLMNQRQLSEAMSEYAQARARIASFELRKLEGNFDIDSRYLGTLDKIVEQQVAAYVDALLAHAKNLGLQAATAYNNARASTGVGASEQIE